MSSSMASELNDTRLPSSEAATSLLFSYGDPMPLRIVRVARESSTIISIEVAREDGASLPAWTPGAHVDVLLPSSRVRQYSLCGDPDDLTAYKFAVLREDGGHGGSVELHTIAAAGVPLGIRPPRNRFPFLDAPRYLFFAGGIGVTPLLPMARAAARQGRRWIFVYGGRTRATMAFTAELGGLAGGALRIVPQDEFGHPVFDPLLRASPPETLVYACGPAAMLRAVEAAAERNDAAGRLRVERFSADVEAAAAAPEDRAFEVVLNRSGRTVHVAADRTLGSVLQEHNAEVTFSCEEGSCGTCETRVLGGVPDHRDSYFSDAERGRNRSMMVCVGRALSTTLVLDA
jgi:ferredoxin-NADP reductase